MRDPESFNDLVRLEEGRLASILAQLEADAHGMDVSELGPEELSAYWDAYRARGADLLSRLVDDSAGEDIHGSALALLLSRMSHRQLIYYFVTLADYANDVRVGHA
jgi:hypothetical protein